MNWLWEGILNMNFNIQVDLINKRKIFGIIKFLQNFNEFQITSTKDIQQFGDLSESFELVKSITKQVCFDQFQFNSINLYDQTQMNQEQMLQNFCHFLIDQKITIWTDWFVFRLF